ncbi:glycoside hydrolase superfamily, partial [Fusarium solani]
LDAARQYYPPDFLVELCSYMSFFKQNTLHLHLSDNLWNNPELFDFEEQMKLYATFRLYSDDPRVKGLNKRPEESYTRQVFDDIQSKCAARGVTILPEIEAPGHALVFSQWKPQIGMSSDYTLLNITHPETIPAVKTVWKVFLPWFHSKTVSIGADEYRDSSLDENALTAEYERFVNELNHFITQESGKKVRIWGTFPPSSGSHVDRSVLIQHWANFEAHAVTDWLANDYNVLNSGDDLYVVSKWSSGYPQNLNQTFIFHGSPDGSAFAPNIFDPANETENTARDDPRIEGHIAPLWTDWGPNSTTILETYYSWRDGLPALADKQWGGKLTEEEYPSLFEALQPFVPDQNLDRRVPSNGPTILEYDFSHSGPHGLVKDKSGNDYDAKSSCKLSKSGVLLSRSCKVTTPLSSKGRDYAFSFSINPTSGNPGPIFTGPDSSLWAGHGSTTNVTLVADDSAYTLNYTFPLNKWTNAKLIGKGPGTFLAVNDQEPMEFLTKIGIRGRRYVWDKIAVEAPLNVIGGGDFEGILGHVKLEDNA